MELRTITARSRGTRRARRAWRVALAACGLAAVAVVSATVGEDAPAHAAQRLDVNEATVEQLTDLPGIGPAKAEAIVAERAQRPFSSVDDLERVQGIGPSTVAELRDRISAGPARRK